MTKYHISIGKKDATIRTYEEEELKPAFSYPGCYVAGGLGKYLGRYLANADLFDSEEGARIAIRERIVTQRDKAAKMFESACSRLETFDTKGPKVVKG